MNAAVIEPTDEGLPPERLLGGLTDVDGRDLALGIGLGPEPGGTALRILGPRARHQAASVVPGKIRLDRDYREIPTLAHAPLTVVGRGPLR